MGVSGTLLVRDKIQSIHDWNWNGELGSVPVPYRAAGYDDMYAFSF